MAKAKQKKRSKLPLVGILLLLLLGLAAFGYPILSGILSSQNAKNEITTYDNTVQNIGNDGLRKFEDEARKYNAALAAHNMDMVSVMDYDKLLSVTESIGYVEIPSIGVYLPIFHGLDDETLQHGIGHMEGTSLPVGGENTHSVLAGHTGLPTAELFTDLDQLKCGDAFYVHTLDKVLKYEVDQINTVLPSDVSKIQIEDGKDLVTLLTCTPYGINSHRLLVRGSRVPYSTQTMEHTDPWPVVHSSEKQLPARSIIWYIAASVIAVVILVMIIVTIVSGIKKKSRKKLLLADSEEINNNTPKEDSK